MVDIVKIYRRPHSIYPDDSPYNLVGFDSTKNSYWVYNQQQVSSTYPTGIREELLERLEWLLEYDSSYFTSVGGDGMW